MQPIRILELTDGDTLSIDMAQVAPPSIMTPIMGGMDAITFAPHAYDDIVKTIERQTFLENWNMVMSEGLTDQTSNEIRDLIKILRRAWQFKNVPKFNRPIYLIQRAQCETDTRWALIRQCPTMTLPSPLFNMAFEVANLVDGSGISLERTIWRGGIPGVLPSASTLTETDGPATPTLVHVANYQDDHAIDTIFRLDAGERGNGECSDYELATNEWLSIADNASLSTGDIDWWFGGWLRFESKATDFIIIGKYDGVAVDNEYVISYSQAQDRFKFNIYDGTGATDVVTADNFGAVPVDTWMFVIAWHIAATSEIGIQVNLCTPDTKTTALTPQDGTRDFTIGGQMGGAGAVPYDGRAASLTFVKEVITQARIESIYNDGTGKEYSDLTAAELASMEAWWEFDVGALLTDSHGANNLTDHNTVTQVTLGAARVWSTNQIAIAAHAIFPAVPAAGDIYYVGSAEAFWDVVWNLVTAGSYTDLVLAYEYSIDGCTNWTALTLGTDLTLYPDSDPWDQLGQVVVNVEPSSTWATLVINDEDKFWLRIRIVSLTAFPTAPANGTDVVYNQRTPEVRLPQALADGDVSPFLMLRCRHPAGGDENPSIATTSRVLIGKKSRGLSSFESRINLGNDGNQAGWLVTADTDTAFAANPQTPGGDWAVTTYVTTTMARRLTIQGTAKLADLEGEYRVFVRAQQTAGSSGDLSIRLIVRINEQTDYAPAVRFPEIDFKSTVLGELIDLTPDTVLKLPFADVFSADDLTNADIFFELWAERNAGSGNINWQDLILIPSEEWIVDLNDPISDSTTGNSALRGLTLLDVDSGIVDVRTVKQIIDGSDIFLAETWSRRSEPMHIEPDEVARLYFLMGHFASGAAWGDPPFIGSQGMHLTAEIFKQDTFLHLRGDT